MPQEFKDIYIISLKKGNASSVQRCLHHFSGGRKCLKRSRMLISFCSRKELLKCSMMLTSFHFGERKCLKSSCILTAFDLEKRNV